ncbi:MAG TPA: hypothetical protein VF657_00305 [Actinoplanes sp.]
MSMLREPQVILFSDDVMWVAEFYRKLGFTETFRTPAQGEPIHIDVALGAYKIGFPRRSPPVTTTALTR